ncbi:MAG: reverse transcriptase domain-containing protein [Oscillochloridaceae bacterium]|nr:reverse transcriptase/maturase family protein [Chloroflexaceae bacterium]MDW8389502.1 reverse transcriptase domain-containing protein [Oscillochloridaceae bacterium]
MKTYKHLFERVCSFDNLWVAFHRARLGKRSKAEVAAFEYHLERNLFTLERELRAGEYRPGGYRHFYIFEPKKRKISAAPFRDRVVHHALCNVIEPIFDRRFIHNSYACRIGKGTHAALDRDQDYARRYRYVLQGDIVQFFPSVDHQVLRGLLARRIADPQVMALIDLILASGAGVLESEYTPQWFPGDDLLTPFERARGLPIGNLTSQFWGNVYLHELDNFVNQDLRTGAYLRYADDWLLFSDDKARLHTWREAISNFLVGLRLVLHDRKTQIYPTATGVPFLGFRLYPEHRRLKRPNVIRFKRRMRRLFHRFADGQIPLERVQASINGWVAHAAHGSTYRLREQLLGGLVVPRRGRP